VWGHFAIGCGDGNTREVSARAGCFRWQLVFACATKCFGVCYKFAQEQSFGVALFLCITMDTSSAIAMFLAFCI
jgi:hypothetical protein